MNDMDNYKKVGLGCLAKNIINNVEGIIHAKSVSLDGSVQFGLKSRESDEEGRPLESIWVDERELVRTGDGLYEDVAFGVPEMAKTDIELGMTVEHFNGFVGIAFERIEYLAGCVHFAVMSTVEKKNKMPDTQFIPCQYLSIKKAPKRKIASADRGGPSSDAPLS